MVATRTPDKSRLLRRTVLTLIILLLTWTAVAGRALVRPSPMAQADAVYVLCCDSAHNFRAAQAIRAMTEAGAQRIFVMNDRSPGYDPAAVTLSYLIQRGLPASYVRVVENVENTFDEAEVGTALATKCGWDRIVIVTSPYHSRRAQWLFERASHGQIEVGVSLTREAAHPWTWWAHASEARDVATEWAKLLAAPTHFLQNDAPTKTATPC